MATGASGIDRASRSVTRMYGRARTASVTIRPKRSRSTASAFPAGTRARFASAIRFDPSSRSSALRSPFPDCGSSEPRELLHTSSANHPVRCAGEETPGRTSPRSTDMPAAERTSAASAPARPAPTTVTFPSGSGSAVMGIRPPLGKEDGERASMPRLGPGLDEPPVHLHDPLGNGQPQPRSPFLGGEERVEDLVRAGRIDSRTGVADRRHRVSLSLPYLREQVEPDQAAGGSGLHGIAHQVPENLLELFGIAVDEKVLQRELFHFHAFLPGLAGADSVDDLADQVRDVHRTHVAQGGSRV